MSPVLIPDTLRAFWNEQAKSRLLGRKIIGVRYMTDEELPEDWGEHPIVIMLDDNSVWYPSRDDEGNGPGSLFGQDIHHKDISLPVI